MSVLVPDEITKIVFFLQPETQFELMDIQESTGTTFVIVTHDQEEAMTVASRVAVMDQGRLIQVATPPVIYESPNSVYVADFIGDVNLIGGGVGDTGEGAELVWSEGKAPLIGQPGGALTKGASATFAIRPEKIAISADEPTDRRNRVQGKILDLGYLGNLSTYHVELPEGPVIKCEVGNRSRVERRREDPDQDSSGEAQRDVPERAAPDGDQQARQVLSRGHPFTVNRLCALQTIGLDHGAEGHAQVAAGDAAGETYNESRCRQSINS